MSDNTDFESANDAEGPGDTLSPMEALDSDEIRNDDGDNVVDPPDHWSEANRTDQLPRGEVGGGESLDEKLAAEVPDAAAGAGDPAADDAPAGDIDPRPEDEIDNLDPAHHGTDAGQISGTPEDGDSLFTVVE
ncbi:hypothetical protein [Mycolicibacterium litorale]|uniref:Uncharacterized protein n=1 Tax=Mycolicibacterium litorale TaxID=758802 RepID=A0AAD1MWW3_9MYCO|nr:hypothetical protein [Mycolicibacterium litorale]MCV7417642.1 hypothetical protein [Mycolicibacterium litorale]TDY06971.1 hypothetical protein BCL50_3312 [Mycolicibacterium litorale]BBY18871.1 hypothetical protein MLIT_44630 [Mycolicibacterium litorale]